MDKLSPLVNTAARASRDSPSRTPQFRSILVLRGGALGDLIVTLPALAALREHWPAARLELAGNATAAALAVNLGLLDAVHSQHDSRWAALFADGPLSSDFAAWLASFELVVNFWPDPDGDLARRFPIHNRQLFITAAALPSCAPAAAHYCAPLRVIGVEASSYFYPIGFAAMGSETRRNSQVGPMRESATTTQTLGQAERPNQQTRPVIAIHPGSGSPRKNWPADRWIRLIQELPSPILLILGEAELETWNDRQLRVAGLARRLHDGSLRIAAGLPLHRLVSELGHCRLFLGHDSGISHLAAACGVPSLLLFGPTDPSIWAPPGPHVRVLRNGSELSSISVADVRQAIAIG